MNLKTENHDHKLPQRLVVGIMAGVAAFGALIAIGVTYRTGKWLALPVVLGVVGCFLGIWYLALQNRKA